MSEHAAVENNILHSDQMQGREPHYVLHLTHLRPRLQ